MPKGTRLPDFPRKELFNSLSNKRIEKRSHQLETFFNSLIYVNQSWILDELQTYIADLQGNKNESDHSSSARSLEEALSKSLIAKSPDPAHTSSAT